MPFFKFSIFSEFSGIGHALFTRSGGVSDGDFQSLNVGLGVGDDEHSVRRNRAAIAETVGAPDMVFLNQIHSARVLTFQKTGLRSHSAAACEPPLSADAMVTDIPGQFLAVQTADCQAILLYDPRRKVVGAVHSGWRGSIANISGACVDVMKTDFGCRPTDIFAGVSPSLGPCCAEFVHYRKEFPEPFWPFKLRSHYFDFWAVTRRQLLDAGLLPEHIELAHICTKCNPHLFFSFRAQKRTGRQAAIIGLQ